MELQDMIFASAWERRFLARYRRFFSIGEIEQSRALQWVFGASLLTFFITFEQWAGSAVLSVRTALEGMTYCWPYFEGCGEIAFLQSLPEGYSQSALYMAFFGLMLLIVYLMARREWLLAHAGMLVLFVWKFLVMFVLTHAFAANFDYYHLVFVAILLFIPHKGFFLKFIFVLLYFIAATIKIDDGWILGTYFTSLVTGLPLFPDALTPLISNIVILMQIVGAWFLLSDRASVRLAALAYMVWFHLYSGILVLYRYPATVLPTLLILFGLFPSRTVVPRDSRSLPGWTLALFLVGVQFIAILIPGDHRLTLEGNYYGLFMFEANHQCLSHTTRYFEDGSTSSTTRESADARFRCDPYMYLQRYANACKQSPAIVRIEWQFDHSVNGGPFYRIVDTKDACGLSYRAFGHNAWIRTPEEGAPVVGYPVRNVYW